VSGIVEAAPKIETESAWIDEHGRYLVRMLFDTAAPGERKASLPIRMVQPHSGPGYGIHFPLRPGTEVMVAFVGGDPDRPIIVGSVPNSMTPTPVVNKDSQMHRIRTWSGVLVEIDDGR
jgi:type VI secretion system secreted protein VgrG